MLLGCSAWCASALASSDIKIPCPELMVNSKPALPAVLDQDVRTPTLQRLEAATIVTLPPLSETGDAAESLPAEDEETGDESGLRNNEIPDLATRLPGVSASDALRFRLADSG